MSFNNPGYDKTRKTNYSVHSKYSDQSGLSQSQISFQCVIKFDLSLCTLWLAKDDLFNSGYGTNTSCTPDEKIQVNPRFWPGLEILF